MASISTKLMWSISACRVDQRKPSPFIPQLKLRGIPGDFFKKDAQNEFHGAKCFPSDNKG
jgi:hypothetical protein